MSWRSPFDVDFEEDLDEQDREARPESPSPGKVSLVQRIGSGAKRRHSTVPGKGSRTAAMAAAGVRGQGQPLPYLDQLQAAFGGHDLGGVRAHVAGPAAAAAGAIDASAYAMGDDVAFAAPPDLRTAAHEAAHVIQQRGGLSLPGGVGAEGDIHERQADAVADAVVRGESAAPLLDQVGRGGSPTTAVQRHPANPRAAGGSTGDAAALSMPGPITLEVLGDRFIYDLTAVGMTPVLRVTYAGELAAEVGGVPGRTFSAPLDPIHLRKSGGDWARPLHVKVIKGHDMVMFDLHGDGLAILEILHMTELSSFDTRSHLLRITVNRIPALRGPSLLPRFDLPLPPPVAAGGAAPVGAGGKAGRERGVIVPLVLGGDAFELGARRFGDSKKVQLTIRNSLQHDQMLVPMVNDFEAASLRILKNDGRTILLDLDGDGKPDARLVHRILAHGASVAVGRRGMPIVLPDFGTGPGSADAGKQTRVHQMRVFDANDVQLDDLVGRTVGWPIHIPPELTAEQPGGQPTGAALAARTPRAQWEIQIDGNGDGTRELVVQFNRLTDIHPVNMVPPDPATVSGRYAITLRHVDSSWKATLAEPMKLTPAETAWFDANGPRLAELRESGGLAVISVVPSTPRDLRLKAVAGGYLVEHQGGFGGSGSSYEALHLPMGAPGPGEAPLTDVKAVKEAKRVGQILFTDIRLGPYGDPFRVTLEDRGVLGVGGISPQGVTSGFGLHVYAPKPQIKVTDADADSVRIALSSVTSHDDPEEYIYIRDRLVPPERPNLHAEPEIDLPSVNRDHEVTIVVTEGGRHGPYRFRIRDGVFQPGFAPPPQFGSSQHHKLAAGALMGTGVIEEQKKNLLTADALIQVDTAVNALVIQMLGEVFKGVALEPWQRLYQDMIMLAGKASDRGFTLSDADMKRVASTRSDVESVLLWLATERTKWLAPLTGIHMQPSYPLDARNPYTGEEVHVAHPGAEPKQRRAPHAERLMARLSVGKTELEQGSLVAALDDYRKMADGVSAWVAELLAKDPKRKGQADQLKYMLAMQRQVRELGGKKNAFRVPAVFVADEGAFAKEKDYDTYKMVPLHLYIWSEAPEFQDPGEQEVTWYIRDITNPQKPFQRKVSVKGPVRPPRELFKQLDDPKHLPKGVLRYHLGEGGDPAIQFESPKPWYDYVADLALVVAAIGLTIATVGAATPLAVAATTIFAASAILGTVAAVGKFAHGLEHGFDDRTSILLNVLDIVSSAASFGALAAGATVRRAIGAGARATAGTGTAMTGAAARMAALSDAVYRPLVGISALADGLGLLVMSKELRRKLAELESIKDVDERRNAQARLLAQFAIMGGLTLLSVRGDLPELKGGGTPRIILDEINGIPVARTSGADIGGARMDLSDLDANRHAAARWQTDELDRAGKQQPASATGQAAADIAKDDKLRAWYQEWLKQPTKLEAGADGKMRVKPFTLKGEPMPEAVVARLQQIADSGDLAALERAMRAADDIAAVRDRLGLKDIDPAGESWRTHRDEIVKALGGDDNARRRVADYERVRLGSQTDDLASFMGDRARINQLIPEGQLDGLRRMYPEGEVYLTGQLANPGAGARPGDLEVELAVIAPKGTDPDLMHAMELRAAGHKVHLEPAFLRARKLPPDTHLRVRVRVMTGEQLAGMVIAGGHGFHKLDSSMPEMLGGKVTPLGGNRFAAEATDIEGVHAAWAARGRKEQLTPLRYDAATNTTSFEIQLGNRQSLRITANLPAPITSVDALLSQTNRIIGGPLPGAAGMDALRKLGRGDLSPLEPFGIRLGSGHKLPGDLEFGLAQIDGGRVVLVRGGASEVDWQHLPGLRDIGHTHPSTPSNELRIDPVSNQRAVSLTSLQRDPGVPVIERSQILPSNADIARMAERGTDGHRVITPFVLHQGLVMKPDAETVHLPRIEYVIHGAVEVGTLNGSNTIVYRARVVGHAGKEPAGDWDVWATRPLDGGEGFIYMKPPDGFDIVPKVGAGAAAPAPSPPRASTTEPDPLVRKAEFEEGLRAELRTAAIPEVVVLDVQTFAKRFESDARGRAVFVLEPGDRQVIYARADATRAEVVSEASHVRQMADANKAAEIRFHHGSALEGGGTGSAADRIEHFRRKVALEIDAAEDHLRRLRAEESPDPRELAEVNRNLADLQGLRRQVEALKPDDIAQMSAGMIPLPSFLDGAPWLFKKRSGGGGSPSKSSAPARKPVLLPRQGSDRSAAYSNEKVVEVRQTGAEWKEDTALASGYEGKAVLALDENGQPLAIVVTGKDKRDSYYILEPGAIIPNIEQLAQGMEVKRGQVLAHEKRTYRRVEIEHKDGHVEKREEIRRREEDGWVQRGTESTRRGSLMEKAARRQVDEQLGDRLGKTAFHVEHQGHPDVGGGGFDDVVIEFIGSGKTLRAHIRIREVKDYPHRWVPGGDFTAIGENLEKNLLVLEKMIGEARKGRAARGFEQMTEDQIKAVEKAYRNDNITVEILLSKQTNLGVEGTSGAKVIKDLRVNIGKHIDGNVFPGTAGKYAPERIDEDHVKAAYKAAEAELKKSKKKTP